MAVSFSSPVESLFCDRPTRGVRKGVRKGAHTYEEHLCGTWTLIIIRHRPIFRRGVLASTTSGTEVKGVQGRGGQQHERHLFMPHLLPLTNSFTCRDELSERRAGTSVRIHTHTSAQQKRPNMLIANMQSRGAMSSYGIHTHTHLEVEVVHAVAGVELRRGHVHADHDLCLR